MLAKLKLGNKLVEIPDIEPASGIKRFTGLMFKPKETNALLFSFDKPTKTPIHSLFCKDFLAIWLDENNKIIEYKMINSVKLSIKPTKDFVKLLEIPLNDKYCSIIKIFDEKTLKYVQGL